jgi:hypothetical protein
MDSKAKGDENMPKGTFYQCETCGQKAFAQIPSTWIHIYGLILQVGKGIYRTTIESYDSDYKRFDNLTFCSMQCLIDWLNAKFPEANASSNPSQRV